MTDCGRSLAYGCLLALVLDTAIVLLLVAWWWL